MNNNPPSLTPLQKATICVNEADGGTSNLSDMLVACQFILGCYNSKQEQSTRLKDKVLTKFTPAQQITEPPKQKITFGNQKGLDIGTIRRLQPNASTKRVTPGINWNKHQTPPPVFQPKPVQRPPTTTTTTPAPTTSNFTNKNVNYNTTSSNTNNLNNNNKPQYSKPIIPPQNDHIPTKTEKPPVKRKFDDDDEEEEETPKEDQFTTAKEKYISDCANKGIKPKSNNTKKTLGGRRKFVVPMKKDEKEKEEEPQNTTPPAGPTKKVSSNAIAKPQTQPSNNNNEENPNGIDNVNGVPLDDERLRNIEPRMLEIICREILDHSPKVDWDDIAGLKFAKKVVWEMVVWPAQNSQLFTGLRTPPKGLLLFGPPGTGKTLIGKAIASSSGATFFSITASSLTSKWIGEGEKMVRALFAVARCYQPAVVFIDEIDSLLTQRSESEHEASRRIKNEFLTQLDGAGTNKEDRLLLVGATNRPQELDEAARRRLVKKVYIPLPDMEARMELIRNLLKKQANSLSDAEIEKVSTQTAGYSGSDLHALCSEAALGPLRALRGQDLREISADKVRPVNMNDFQKAKRQVRASVGETELHVYEDWNKMYGSVEQFRMEEEDDDDIVNDDDDVMDEIT